MDIVKVKKLLGRYQEYLIVDKGLSRRTAEGYSRSLSIALRRMRKYCPQYQEIKDHILWMHNKNYSYSHIRNTTLSLEQFTALKGNPVRFGRSKKPKRILTEFLSESEITRLLAAANNCIRRKAIVSLLAYSGIRNQELCNLKVQDVDLGANELRVLGGKGIRDRITNISSECTRTLIEYLSLYPRNQDGYLFTTLTKGGQLSTWTVRKHLRILKEKAQIERRVYPHLLRHSLASNLLKRGAGIILIKNQLGHAWIESTMIYTQSTSYRAKSEYDYFKPAYM